MSEDVLSILGVPGLSPMRTSGSNLVLLRGATVSLPRPWGTEVNRRASEALSPDDSGELMGAVHPRWNVMSGVTAVLPV